MAFLLDTHAFLWWITNDERLGTGAKRTLSSTNMEIYFSVVSAWEIAVKSTLGKLKIKKPLSNFLIKHISDNQFKVLNIELKHCIALEQIKQFHKDPFDHLLICQAQTDNLKIISKDKQFKKYDVDIIW